ncbi:ABC transporter permease subunit [Arthrobacter sp. Br18]|uniref:ABC transporter permease subunit n=1 Tax=Arthrobacter sp. Br18 TaxID=1312954 RepID=UPI00047ABFAB|nr:ABC transporter permease subunit [Arthrobacter sp. Br18]
MENYLTLFETYDVPAAFWANIQLTFWAAIWATLLGTLLALFRISPIASLQFVGAAYVNIFRNTPLTIIIAFGVLGLFGQLQVSLTEDFNLNFFRLAILGLSLYHAAFVCEAIRSGVNTVPLGQAEAARAIGLSFLPAARLVILPQAFRGAVAPLGNVLIALIKNSTVAAAGSVAIEASSLMKTMIEFRGDLVIPIFLTFALGFVIIVIPVGLLTTWASRKLAVAR